MSIPKILHAYWQGGPLPWLRWLTLATFARWHPGWSIRFHRSSSSGLTPRPPDQASDLYRWTMLSRWGGVWSDLDVIWLGSIDPVFEIMLEEGASSALTLDGGTPGPNGPAAIGVVVAEPGAPAMRLLDRRAHELADVTRHQSAGTELVCRLRPLPDAANIPARLFYPHGFGGRDNARLWSREEPDAFFEGLIGLHWGGGWRTSREFCRAESLPRCAVRQAVERGLL